MAFNEDDEYRNFTEPFDLIILGETLSWVPGSITLVYDPTSEKAGAISRSIDDFIARWANYGYELAVTPVGPFLIADITDPYTFVWAANSLYGDTGIEVEGVAPTMKEMGLSGEEYDPNTNPRIY